MWLILEVWYFPLTVSQGSSTCLHLWVHLSVTDGGRTTKGPLACHQSHLLCQQCLCGGCLAPVDLLWTPGISWAEDGCHMAPALCWRSWLMKAGKLITSMTWCEIWYGSKIILKCILLKGKNVFFILMLKFSLKFAPFSSVVAKVTSHCQNQSTGISGYLLNNWSFFFSFFFFSCD